MQNPYKRHQPSPPKWAEPTRIIFLLGIVTIISSIVFYAMSTKNSIQKYNSDVARLADAKKRAANQSPTNYVITSGKLNLHEKETQLSDQYTKISQEIFGGYGKPEDYRKHKNEITKYFSSSGYQQLQQILIGGSKSNSFVVPTKNTGVRVAFSSFNPSSNRLSMVVYTTFDIDLRGGDNDNLPHKGVCYMNITYDLKSDSAQSITIQNSTVN